MLTKLSNVEAVDNFSIYLTHFTVLLNAYFYAVFY